MPNGSLTNPAEHIAQANAASFTQKTLSQGAVGATGSFDVIKVLIQH